MSTPPAGSMLHLSPQEPSAPAAADLTPAQRLSAACAALLVGSIAGSLLLGLCFGLSLPFGWTPEFALVSGGLALAAALAAGAWMLRLALAVERAWPGAGRLG